MIGCIWPNVDAPIQTSPGDVQAHTFGRDTSLQMYIVFYSPK